MSLTRDPGLPPSGGFSRYAPLFGPVLLLVGLCLRGLGAEAGLGDQGRRSAVSPAGRTESLAPKWIALPKAASALESFAANEVRRYVYLRTGRLLPVNPGAGSGDRIAVSRKDRQLAAGLGSDLGPQQFLLKSDSGGGGRTWWIVGGDDTGVLYGAYRFAEKLGVSFGLEEDVVPDEPWVGAWPEPNEMGKPRFVRRGLQPFHDFSVGPDWWNLQDYQSVLSQMAKLRLNFIGFHTYPSWNPAAGPEANVWIGLPEDVDAQGNVRSGYEAGVVTTRRGWAVTPFPTHQYAAGAALMFEGDDYGPDYMLGCLEWPRTLDTAAAMFNRYGDLQQRAFAHARALGIQTCVGTELPLGVPPALVARLKAKGLRADDPAVLQRLYEGTFLRLMRKTPVDYYWFWTPEIWLGAEPGCPGWEITTRANTERDLRLAQSAARSVGAPFQFATCGWRLGTRDDPRWMDQRTPITWVASSINTGLGRDPVEKTYGALPDRPKWVIGWAEDDDTAGAHCCTCWDLQLWVERMFRHAAEARQYGCEGMMAIHWRTASISPNISALARAGWDYLAIEDSGAGTSRESAAMPDAEAFWVDWGRSRFGLDAGPEIGRAFRKLDGSHLAINALIGGGTGTPDARITELFAPLRELERLRGRVIGPGNLERLDYWLQFIRASELRVRTWVLAARLAAKMKEATALPAADAKRDFMRAHVLPLRVDLARSYEALIGALVDCAKSPGELGTISSLESGSRDRIVCAHDSAIAQVLTLPAEAGIRGDYQGKPRILVLAKPSRMNPGEPQEVRAFVLSRARCTAMTLFWRRLGEGPFRKTNAGYRGRQAYRAVLPARSQGTLEYYLEASLEDGGRLRWPVTAPAMNQTLVVW